MRIAPPHACIFATPPRRPHGFTVMEFVAASAMLAVLIAVIGQLVVQTKRQAASAERREFALMAIENAMEQVTARPWDEISDEAVTEYELPAGLKKRWPAAALSGKVVETSESLESKQISLELKLSNGSRERPISLTTWIYRSPREEASP